MSKGKSGASKFALGALIGGAVGAIAGILTAPKSGKETRQDIKEKAGEAKDFADEKIEQGKKLADKKIKAVKGKLGGKAEKPADQGKAK